MNTRFCYGKKPARLNAVRFQLKNYLDLSKLPTPPDEFGRTGMVKDWNMLANDRVGCCVFSGGSHETMQWNKEAGREVVFDEKSVLSDFAAVTGYDPAQTDMDGNNPTDNGTDMQAAAEYRRTVGLLDASGKRHKILAYLAIQRGHLDELYLGMYLFKSVGLGIQCPDSMQDQFAAGEPWSVVKDDEIEGGHYVPALFKTDGLIQVVTWGAVQGMTPEFYKQYNDESIVYLTDEDLVDGKTLEGFALADLQSDLAALKPTWSPFEDLGR
jgi:hypothetical protein